MIGIQLRFGIEDAFLIILTVLQCEIKGESRSLVPILFVEVETFVFLYKESSY